MLIDTAKDLGWAPSNYFPDLQSWLDSGEELLFLTPGVHDVAATLTCATPNVKITGPGVLRVTTAEVDALALTADDQSVSGLRIDGNLLGRYGVHATGARSDISDCRIWNLRSTTGSARGIFTSSTGGTTLRRNRIWNIDAPGNDTQGDGNGMVRGIAVHALGDAVTPSVIEGNIIYDITGEEADGISVLYSDTVTNPYMSGYTLISRNVIRNAGRRYIKLQGSDIIVDGNWCYSTPDYVVVNPSSMIDVVQGQRIEITNNRAEDRDNTACVSISGPSDAVRVDDITVRGNWLREANNTSPVVYCTRATNVAIDSNTLIGGQYYVSGSVTDSLRVTNNACRGGDPAMSAFNFSESANGTVQNNTLPADKRGTLGVNFVFERNR